MYAIIELLGKQFKVREGDKLLVPLIDKDDGEVFTCDEVLLYSDDEGKVMVGRPFVKSVKVEGKVLSLFKDKKIIVYKYKRRKDYHKKQGHRQKYTEVLIEKISSN